MKKVLIISYFFPPANLAGSYRIASWAKHLHKFGYYPVIITRCWNENQTETTDQPVNNKFSHEKYETYEVYRLPYHQNLRDRIHQKYGEHKLRLFRKFLTFSELFLQHYTNGVIPYSNLYEFAKDLIKKEGDFESLIVSGRPYQLFKFADQLHKETGIKWIADYRDEWNTHQWLLDESIYRKLMRWVESKSEKKWLKTASLFTTCSENWVQNIGNFINRPGRVVLNGYEDNLLSAAKTKKESDTFIIAHNGTIFSTQIVEVFLEGFKNFIDETPDANIRLLFPGVENSIEALRIHSNSLGYEKYISTSSRIPKSELIDILSSAHIFLMVGTQGVKGHHSSKIFEYLALQKPIMLTPDDNDVMAELILKTKAGFIAKDSEEVKKFLIKIYSDFVAGKPIDYSPDMEEISFYSREKQAEILSGILNEVALMP